MSKVYDITKDNLILKTLYDKKISLKDYDGALSVVRRMENAGIDRESIYFYYATTYYLLGIFHESINFWFRYLSVCNDKKRVRAYNGLGACFFNLGDEKKAGYYFNLQLSLKPKTIYPYDDVLKEFYKEVTNVKKAYVIAYPYEKADFTPLLDKCFELAKASKYEEVINELKIIPPTSKFYGQAVMQTAICHFFLENNDIAVNLAKKAVFLEPKNATAICNAISILSACENKESVKEYVKKLSDISDILSDEDSVKAIMVLADVGEYTLAKKIALNYLKNNRYDAHVLYILGIVEYNLGNYENALNAFLKNYRLIQSALAKYYIKQCEIAIEKKKANKRVKKMPFIYDIPDDEKFKICERLAIISNKKPKELTEELKEICAYCFSSSSQKSAFLAIDVLFGIKCKKSVEFLKQKLLEINVYDKFKRAIISCFILDGFNGELSVVLGGIFKKIKLQNADFYGENAQIFKNAYAYLIAESCLVVDDLEKLREGAYAVYGSLVFSGNNENVDDYKALAAVMFEASNAIKNISKKDLALFFETTTKKVKKVRDLYLISYSNETPFYSEEVSVTSDENLED